MFIYYRGLGEGGKRNKGNGYFWVMGKKTSKCEGCQSQRIYIQDTTTHIQLNKIIIASLIMPQEMLDPRVVLRHPLVKIMK